MPTSGLVIFDVDGTLLRGPTICEMIAASIGRSERMAELERGGGAGRSEVVPAREEMAGWYMQVGREATRLNLDLANWAPGVVQGFEMLRESGWRIALASVTWKMAVDQIAEHFGIEHVIATDLDWTTGDISHVFPEDKAAFLDSLAAELGLSVSSTAAVGDSAGDIPMLERAGRGVFVGRSDPQLQGVAHLPDAAIDTVAETLLTW